MKTERFEGGKQPPQVQDDPMDDNCRLDRQLCFRSAKFLRRKGIARGVDLHVNRFSWWELGEDFSGSPFV